ncbi:ABC transporter permease [Oceanospirillum linum]|uniref:ABC transporter permease n=1 Tax=Oceanospirillum linum TaxID=966 RepID=UPI00089F6701|nr:ABC transporter permease [Oceanospirillum linum]SEF69935.1 lipopolysaccharide transport system permease protein [Oleiphilus messinensis]SMP15163.1 lipopolysaccharide transport system permease protein [Oceanospirillum linum]
MRAYFWPRQHAGLLLQMTQREILQRYRGSWLGMGWSVITPVMMLAVYTFVFQSVFQARWPGAVAGDSDGLHFALNLFAGLIFFTFFTDVLTRAPGVIAAQPNLVKKVVFPLHLLPWIAILSASFQALISLVVLLVGVFLMTGTLPDNVLFFPLLLVLFMPLLLGLALGLSALGVYFTDAQHIVTILTAPLMFLSPIFYPVSMLPEWAQEWIYLNPLTLIIELSRTVFLGSPWPDTPVLVLYGVISLAVALAGGILFYKLRRGFSDVL